MNETNASDNDVGHLTVIKLPLTECLLCLPVVVEPGAHFSL